MLNKKRIEPTTSQKVGYRWVVEKKFVDNQGKISSYTTIGDENSHSAGVVAITTDNKVVVARQFRPGPEIVMDELPGGGVEESEDFADAARRELSEETGYKSDSDIIHLGDISKDAYSNGLHHYYLLKDCYKYRDTHNDEGEVTEPCEISITKFISNAKLSKMSDSIAVLLAYEELINMENKSEAKN